MPKFKAKSINSCLSKPSPNMISLKPLTPARLKARSNKSNLFCSCKRPTAKKNLSGRLISSEALKGRIEFSTNKTSLQLVFFLKKSTAPLELQISALALG